MPTLKVVSRQYSVGLGIQFLTENLELKSVNWSFRSEATMAVDENLKIELGKQGVFVTTIPGALQLGAAEFGLADAVWAGMLRDRDDCDNHGAL